MGSSQNPIGMPIHDPTDPGLDHTSNWWPLEDHHYAEGFAFSVWFNIDDPPFWSGLLHPPLALLPFEKITGFTSTATKTSTPSNIEDIHSYMRAAA